LDLRRLNDDDPNFLTHANAFANWQYSDGIGLREGAHPATSRTFERAHDETSIVNDARDGTAIMHICVVKGDSWPWSCSTHDTFNIR
jgi:hypothetical protein